MNPYSTNKRSGPFAAGGKSDILHWYAVYTKPRHEKLVYSMLTDKGVECYLPLVKEVRQWSDRRKRVEEPVIRGYVFVHVTPRKTLDVLQTFGVVRFIMFQECYAIIPDFQIEALKRAIESGMELRSREYLQGGQLVEVIEGPLKGVIGSVQRFENEDRFVIRLDAVKTSYELRIESRYLRPISDAKKKKIIFRLPLGMER